MPQVIPVTLSACIIRSPHNFSLSIFLLNKWLKVVTYNCFCAEGLCMILHCGLCDKCLWERPSSVFVIHETSSWVLLGGYLSCLLSLPPVKLYSCCLVPVMVRSGNGTLHTPTASWRPCHVLKGSIIHKHRRESQKQIHFTPKTEIVSWVLLFFNFQSMQHWKVLHS